MSKLNVIAVGMVIVFTGVFAVGCRESGTTMHDENEMHGDAMHKDMEMNEGMMHEGSMDKETMSSENMESMMQRYSMPEAKMGDKVYCPVMHKNIVEVNDKSLYVEVKGKKYYVCCSMCVNELKKDPDKYLK
jgi:YHS domain-containing protein